MTQFLHTLVNIKNKTHVDIQDRVNKVYEILSLESLLKCCLRVFT